MGNLGLRGGESTNLLGQQGFGAHELHVGQHLEGLEQLRHLRAQAVGELAQDAYDLAALIGLELADVVVGFHDFLRLYEDGLARGALVVDDALDLALQRRRHGDDEAAVAHGGRHVLCHGSFRLRVP